MEQEKDYFVFISYSNLDANWAIWLRHELEHYHLPASFNGRTDVRDNLRKVFRDRDELSAGPEWDAQVQKALENTNNLIVVCSPNSAESKPVNKEVETFMSLGKEDHIFPFIVEGDTPNDCFPKSLNHSKLGGDVNKDGGRDSAFIKVVAGMLKVSFPSLWNHYEIEKAEEERKIREQRDKLLRIQSLFLAEKTIDLVEIGDSYTARLLALEALPKDLANENRPLVKEAKLALRRACEENSALLTGDGYVDNIHFSTNGKHIIGMNFSSEWNRISYITTFNCWDTNNGKLIATRKAMCLSPDAHFFARELADGTFAVYETISEKLHYSFDLKGNYIQNAAFAFDSKKILLLLHSGEIWILDISKNNYLQIFRYEGKLIDVRISQDVRKLSILSSIAKGKGGKTWRVSVWNLETHEKEINSWGIPSKGIDSIEFSYDANYVIVRKNGKKLIEILEVYKNGNKLHVLKQEKDELVEHVVSCKNEKILLSASCNSLYLWDLETGWSLPSMHHKLQDKITSLYMSDDGHIIIAVTKNNVLHRWNAITGEELMPVLENSIISSVAISSTGNRFAYASGGMIKMKGENISMHEKKKDVTVQFVEEHVQSKISDALTPHNYSVSVDDRKVINVQERKTGKVFSWNTNKDVLFAIISPDSNYLVTEDKCNICVWNIFTGKLTDSFEKEDNYKSHAIYFSPDGTIHAIYKSRADSSIIQYTYTPLNVLLERTRQQFLDRQLTQEEKKKYYIDDV